MSWILKAWDFAVNMNLAHQSLLTKGTMCMAHVREGKTLTEINLYSMHTTRKKFLFGRTACTCVDTFFGKTLSSSKTHPTLEQICQNVKVTKPGSFTLNLGLAESAISHSLCMRTLKQRRLKLHRNISLVWRSPRCEIASRAFCVNSHSFPSLQAWEIDVKMDKIE